jgi:hypothetical protein
MEQILEGLLIIQDKMKAYNKKTKDLLTRDEVLARSNGGLFRE